jgi:hypothetical protein
VVASLLFFLVFLPDSSAKEKEFFFRCPSFDEAYASVYYCSENPTIVSMAQKCEADLRAEWTRANRELKQVMSLTQRPDYSRQELEFQHTQGDYDKTMKKISHLINVTNANADVVATYSRALVDRPDADEASGDTSACFQEAKREVQKVVDNLEQMIDEGLLARGEAGGLKDIAQYSDEHLENLTEGPVAAQDQEEAYVPARVAEREGPHQSDISGLPEEMEKGITRLPASTREQEKKKGDYIWMERLIDTTKIEAGK